MNAREQDAVPPSNGMHSATARAMLSRRACVAAGLAVAATIVGTGAARMSSAERKAGLGGTSVPASPAATPAAPPAATPVVGQEIEIAAVNGLRFSPTTVSIPAQRLVRIVFTNRTASYHDLVIPTLGKRTPRIGPDETCEVLVRADAGSYRFYCSIPSHTQAGMEGVITAR